MEHYCLFSLADQENKIVIYPEMEINVCTYLGHGFTWGFVHNVLYGVHTAQVQFPGLHIRMPTEAPAAQLKLKDISLFNCLEQCLFLGNEMVNIHKR